MKKWNRRKFLKTGALGLTAAVVPFSFYHYFKKSSRRPSGNGTGAPNVLFITVDDVGWLDLSCYGNENIETPYLDTLAREGMMFKNAFGVSSSCSPSRASFITGQYISTHGVDGLTHRYPRRQLSPFRKTMPKYLLENGYHTAIEGKWHVSPFLPTALFGYELALGSALPWEKHIKHTRRIKRYFKSRAEDEQPFYLELNFTDTHRNAKGKFQKDPKFTVNPDSIKVPEWMGLPDWPEIRTELAFYYENLQKTDFLIGETLKALKDNNLEENTIVVFVSDNGSPFPGNKMTLLDRGIGTPLLVKFPGKVESGRVSEAMISTIDIMPTILDLCQVKKGKEMEGESFINLLTNSEVRDEHRSVLLSEMNCHVHSIPMRAIRNNQWKAILNLNNNPIGLDDLEDAEWAHKLCELPDQPWLKPRPQFELYDLVNDPHEKKNLAGISQYANVEAEFRRELSEDWEKIKKLQKG